MTVLVGLAAFGCDKVVVVADEVHAGTEIISGGGLAAVFSAATLLAPLGCDGVELEAGEESCVSETTG